MSMCPKGFLGKPVLTDEWRRIMAGREDCFGKLFAKIEEERRAKELVRQKKVSRVLNIIMLALSAVLVIAMASNLDAAKFVYSFFIESGAVWNGIKLCGLFLLFFMCVPPAHYLLYRLFKKEKIGFVDFFIKKYGDKNS